jgi:hypothetical protein
MQKMEMRFFALKGAVPKGPADMAVEVLPAGERLPLFGSFRPQTSDAVSRFLHLQPMAVDGASSNFDWAAPPAVGTAVELRRDKPPPARKKR